jgi:hypothetical protein
VGGGARGWEVVTEVPPSSDKHSPSDKQLVRHRGTAHVENPLTPPPPIPHSTITT